MYETPKDIRTYDELAEVTADCEVQCSIIIRGSRIQSLGEIKKINGSLGLSDSNISSLGELECINGQFWISSHSVHLPLTTLGKLKYINGYASLRYSNIESLGELTEVQGKLSLRDTPIHTLGKLKIVQGSLFLPKRFKGSKELESIEVSNKIRFWADSNLSKPIAQNLNVVKTISERPAPKWDFEYIKSISQLNRQSSAVKEFYSYFRELVLKGHKVELNGYDNYVFALTVEFRVGLAALFNLPTLRTHYVNISTWYPITKSYLADSFIGQITKESEFGEIAWAIEYFEPSLNSSRINNLVEIFSLEKLKSLFKFSSEFESSVIMCSVGKKETEKKLEEAWELRKKYGLFDLTEAKKYEKLLGKGTADGLVLFYILGKDCLTSFGHRHKDKILRAATLNIIEFEEINGPFLHSVWWTKLHQFMNETIRNAENEIRLSMGMPRIGEGWVSETELFYLLKEHFINEEIVHHASPNWLGRQHFDIYFPKYRIAVEYQGRQHFEPIDFFGGEKAFIATKERDERKLKLCVENECSLIYSLPGESKIKLIKEIEFLIKRVDGR